MNATISRAPYGSTQSGESVDQFTLDNGCGVRVRMITYGGILTHIETPDRHGQSADVLLGYDTLAEYEADASYQGAAIGRFGNRIANAQFTLGDTTYTLAANDPPNHLHGGERGYHQVIWNAQEIPPHENTIGIELTYRSPDGEAGYPGNLEITMRYFLTRDHEFRIEYEARTDRATPINLTNHAYWNLRTAAAGDILAHYLTLNAAHYLPVNAAIIPTGDIETVSGTPLDFRTPHIIGERIGAVAGGYDHCFVLRGESAKSKHELQLAATLYEPSSGRIMDVLTTEPAIQFYSGNFLDGTSTGKENTVYQQHRGLCLETQHYPDSPNQPAFPTTILQPGAVYHHTTAHRFSCDA